MRFLPLALACALVAAISPASAAVSTTNCGGDADTCTLTQLFAGGSIQVDDVTFGSFAPDGDFSTVAVDFSTIFFTGAGAGTNEAWVDVVFSPTLEIAGDVDLIDFLLTALVTTTSRTILSATLSFVEDGLEITGDATAAVTTVLDGSIFLDIFDDSLAGVQTSQTSALSSLTSLSVLAELKLLGFETAAVAQARALRFLVTLSESAPPAEVPLPAAAPIFLAGLAGFAFARKRRRAL